MSLSVKYLAAAVTMIFSISKPFYLNLYDIFEQEREWVITQYGSYEGKNSAFYTIEGPEDELLVIDGGWRENAPYVAAVIEAHGGLVDLWILTHPHQDHIGAFLNIYQESETISIGRIVTAQMPSPQLCRENAPWDDMTVYQELLDVKPRELQYLHKGDKLEFAGLEIAILSAYDDYVDVSSNDLINDGSLLFKVSGDRESMLFCSDVGAAMSEFLLEEYGSELKADYLQMGHHGYGGLSDEFYHAVEPQAAYFDAPSFLMEDSTGAYDNPENAEFMEWIGSEVYSFETAPNEIILK